MRFGTAVYPCQFRVTPATQKIQSDFKTRGAIIRGARETERPGAYAADSGVYIRADGYPMAIHDVVVGVFRIYANITLDFAGDTIYIY